VARGRPRQGTGRGGVGRPCRVATTPLQCPAIITDSVSPPRLEACPCGKS
jgi:hypothetical protein